MNLFLDTSVVLAACGTGTGASRYIFENAVSQDWKLQTSSYVLSEVAANLPRLAPSATPAWASLQAQLQLVPDVVSFHWANVFTPAKDRPILFTAAAWSDVLLTLDRRDFAELLGQNFYQLAILRPGEFLKRQRASGRL